MYTMQMAGAVGMVGMVWYNERLASQSFWRRSPRVKADEGWTRTCHVTDAHSIIEDICLFSWIYAVPTLNISCPYAEYILSLP